MAFGQSLIAIAKTLRDTTRALADRQSADRMDAEYTVTKLSFDSPPTAVFQGKVRGVRDEILYETKDFFVNTIEQIQSGKPIPGLAPRLLRRYHSLGEVVRRTQLQPVLKNNGNSVEVRAKLADRLALVLTDAEEVDGSVEGYLKFINLHGGKNVFRIYPAAGPSYVTCRFSTRLIGQAKAAIDEYVDVAGTLVYEANAAHPYQVRVKDIDVLPRIEAGPTFDDLWGVAGQLEITSEALLREARRGWI